MQIAMIPMQNTHSVILHWRDERERAGDMTVAECSHMQAPEIKYQGCTLHFAKVLPFSGSISFFLFL
jgi:hypothetical protein